MAPPFTKPHIEPCLKRVRVLFGGKFVVDTRDAKLVWETPYYPTHFFPHSALHTSYLHSRASPEAISPGIEIYDLVVGNKRAAGAVTKYIDNGKDKDLNGLLKVNWGAADGWFEEDEQIWGHSKDPYKRVDVLQSSRHVRIEVNGVEIANTTKPRLLFETLLRPRTYIPKTDCHFEFLEESRTTSQCPYKGVANYYNVRLPSDEVLKDIVWWYRTPQLECEGIKGFVAFYDEKVDVWVDGQKVPKA